MLLQITNCLGGEKRKSQNDPSLKCNFESFAFKFGFYPGTHAGVYI